MNTQKCPLTEDEKLNMISEEAFLKSSQRDQPGDPTADWLQAENDVEKALASECRSKPSFQDQSLYERMRKEVTQILAKAEGAVNQEFIHRILEKVTVQMHQKGDFLPETIDRAANRLKKDFNGGVDVLKHQWDDFRIRQRRVMEDWKVKGNEVLNAKAKAFYEWTSKRRNKNQP